MFPRLLKIFIVLVLVSASLGRKCFEELRFHGKTSETLPIEFSDRFLVGSVYSGDAETKFTIQRNDDFFFNVTVLEKGLFFSWPGVLVLPLFVLLLFSVLSNVVVCYFRRRNGEGDERPREPLPPVPPPLRVVPFGEDRRLRQKEERPQLRNNEYLDTERDSINSVYGFNNAISPLE
ncbi:uncharacterized protein LOC143038046 isoform X3 [Oratosquilla oratoria]|uniref:uncharacterized protein LOC143038046 isoform X3 n=1 Tax=Oratosquilla oratoria TaxID=337810 RepID=UPI003F769DC5